MPKPPKPPTQPSFDPALAASNPLINQQSKIEPTPEDIAELQAQCTHVDGYGSMMLDGACMLCGISASKVAASEASVEMPSIAEPPIVEVPSVIVEAAALDEKPLVLPEPVEVAPAPAPFARDPQCIERHKPNCACAGAGRDPIA